VLFGQTRITPGGPDIFDTQIPAGDAGQGKARPQYLPPSLACTAIDENGFHAIIQNIY